MKSHLQPQVKDNITEAETDLGMDCMKSMLFSMHVMESLGLKVKKPMVLHIDNKGMVDLVNNWSMTG